MDTDRDLPAGSVVRLVRSSRASHRFPNRIGSLALVVGVPVHPNTWYVVQTTDGASIKMQATGLALEATGRDADAAIAAIAARAAGEAPPAVGQRALVLKSLFTETHCKDLVRATGASSPRLAGQLDCAG